MEPSVHLLLQQVYLKMNAWLGGRISLLTIITNTTLSALAGCPDSSDVSRLEDDSGETVLWRQREASDMLRRHDWLSTDRPAMFSMNV